MGQSTKRATYQFVKYSEFGATKKAAELNKQFAKEGWSFGAGESTDDDWVVEIRNSRGKVMGFWTRALEQPGGLPTGIHSKVKGV